MHKEILKFYVTIVFLTLPLSALANNSDRGMSRRGFLRGLMASAGAAAAAPSILATSTHAVIPASIKLKLAQLRIARLRINSLDNDGSGLQDYIEQLTKIMETTDSARVKDFLGMRIEKAERALSVYNQIQAASTGEVTSSHNTKPQGLKASEQERLNQMARENKEKIKALGDLDQIPADIKILLIRGLLDVELMNRMAWQAHFGIESKVLNPVDLKLLEKYRFLLLQTAQEAAPDSLAAILALRFIKEADFVLGQNASWRQRHGQAMSCKSLI